MAISVRKRGEVWHARGTVRIGKDTIVVPEYSTGQSARADAVDVADREAARLRDERLEGAAGRARRLTIGDCFASYLSRPAKLQPYDIGRVGHLNDLMGHRPVTEAPQGWQTWLQAHPKASPGTAARWRTILLAALRAGCQAAQVPPPRLPTIRQNREVRVIYLSAGERRRLLAAYPPHAACPALLLAYQGMRTQEVLRLDWRAVDLTRETIHVRSDGTKSGRGRSIPMHGRVRLLLVGMWHAAGQPDVGPVFRSSRGHPYQDTRGFGGNPLKKQHAAACTAAGVRGFRVHDWRHDWSARCVMSGMDLYTLMRLGGWSTLRMVERYASVSGEHMREAVRRIA